MIEVNLVKEGVSETRTYDGKFFMEYGFSKEDHQQFHEKYMAAINKAFSNIERLKHENPDIYSLQADAIHKKIHIEQFVPKINEGLIRQLKKVIKGQQHNVIGIVKKNNGNVQFILGDELKGPNVVKDFQVIEGDEEVANQCPDCKRTFKSDLGLRNHSRTCKAKKPELEPVA